ncbi:MAG: hypothetical protein ACE5GM_00510 [bacterium]
MSRIPYTARISEHKYFLLFLMFGLPMSLYAYAGGFNHPFRSDTYLAYNFFNTLSFNLKNMLKVARFEMFGHRRIIPLSHLIMFIQYKILGTNHFLYHLFQYLLHVINSVLTYFLVKRLTRNNLAACIASLLFITFYSHFDIINWTYHTFVMLSCTSFLTAFLAIQSYFQKPKKRYLFLSVGLLFLTLLVYESNVFLPLSGVIFFLFLHYKDGLSSLDFKRALKILIPGVSFCYMIFFTIFYSEAHRQAKALQNVSQAGARSFSQILSHSNIADAWSTTWRVFLNSIFMKGFGFPSGIDIREIIFLEPVTFRPFSAAFILASIALFIFLVTFKIKKRDVPSAVLFFAILLSYIFIISLGRGDYAISQPRYAYFPNLILAVLISLLIKEKAAQFSYLLLAATLTIATLNSARIYRHTALTTRSLATLTRYLSEIKQFKKKNKNDFKLFVDFPVVQPDRKFNLGMDIALDVYFHKEDIITRNVYKARYIYDRKRGIYENHLYDKGVPEERDFTIGFVYYQTSPRNIKEFTVVGKRDGDWNLSITRDSRMVFEADWIRDGEMIHRRFVPDVTISKYKWSHIILQKEKSKLYVLQNGTVVNVWEIGDYHINFDKNSILGDYYTGAGATVYVTQLFVALGRADYDLADKIIGNVIDVEWRQAW